VRAPSDHTQDEEEEFVKLAISMQKGRVEEKREAEAPANDEDAADEKKKE
jgi:hypothetical protein